MSVYIDYAEIMICPVCDNQLIIKKLPKMKETPFACCNMCSRAFVVKDYPEGERKNKKFLSKRVAKV